MKVVVTNNPFAEDDPAYQRRVPTVAARILSRLKTLLETGRSSAALIAERQ